MYGYLYNNDDQLAQQNILIQQDLEVLVELMTAPIVQIDYEQNLYPIQQFQISWDETDTSVIWPIPAPPTTSQQILLRMAASLNMSKRQPYWAPRAAMTEFMGVELVQYAPGITTRGWDNDADQQLLQASPFSKDSIGDYEFTNLIVIPRAWDADPEQQFSQLGYQLDREVIDSAVEKITLPAQFYDTDAEQQFSQPLYQLDRDLADTGVEKITLVPIVDYTWDDDGQNQFLQPAWALDVFDAIIIIPVITPTINVFVLGTGTAISLQVASGNSVEEYVVQGSTTSKIAASGTEGSGIQASGVVQPLIDAQGNLLSADGKVH